MSGETMKRFESFLNEEAEHEGKKVKLNKPFRTPDGPKKFSVYVKNSKGNVVKVNFGDPNMEIKRDDPERRKSFRARHNCSDKTDKTKAGYWSCYQWRAGKKVEEEIHKRGDEWVVTDSSGKKVLGRHKSEVKAKAQLAAIEISKNKNLKEQIQPSNSFVVVLHNKIIHTGNKKQMLAKVRELRKKDPSLTLDDIFLGRTVNPKIGDNWK